jgi:hypothetical protein
MTTQNYLMINPENVVDNICIWDGDTNTWQPPEGYTMLVQATTPALVWELNADKTDYVLVEQIGVGAIGFTWNVTTQVLTTNQPKPNPPTQQPTTEGTQTL